MRPPTRTRCSLLVCRQLLQLFLAGNLVGVTRQMTGNVLPVDDGPYWMDLVQWEQPAGTCPVTVSTDAPLMGQLRHAAKVQKYAHILDS